MYPIERAVEQLSHIGLDAFGVYRDASEKFVPLVERGLADTVKVETGDLRLCVRTSLILGDERHSHAHEDGRRTCGERRVSLSELGINSSLRIRRTRTRLRLESEKCAELFPETYTVLSDHVHPNELSVLRTKVELLRVRRLLTTRVPEPRTRLLRLTLRKKTSQT